MVRKKILLQNNYKFYTRLLDILWDEGFIYGYRMEKDCFKIFLKYKNNKPVIKSINFISKPGHKIYYRVNQLWKLNIKNGLLIVSTNKGLMTLTECKISAIGGQPLVVVK